MDTYTCICIIIVIIIIMYVYIYIYTHIYIYICDMREFTKGGLVKGGLTSNTTEHARNNDTYTQLKRVITCEIT